MSYPVSRMHFKDVCGDVGAARHRIGRRGRVEGGITVQRGCEPYQINEGWGLRGVRIEHTAAVCTVMSSCLRIGVI